MMSKSVFKQKRGIILLTISGIIIVLIIAGILFIRNGNGDYKGMKESETTEGTEIKNSSETVENSGLIEQKNLFTLWSDSAIYLQETKEVFEGFSLAEYSMQDKRYPVLYNDEMILIFKEESMELEEKSGDGTSYSIALKEQLYSGDYITDGRASGKWLDMNGDGENEFVITKWESGTGFKEQKLCVIDIHNKNVIPKTVQMTDLVAALPEFKVLEENLENGILESVEIGYQLDGKDYTVSINMDDKKTDTSKIVIDIHSDYYYISEEGKIYTEAPLLFDTNLSHEQYIGVVRCALEYEQKTDSFVLDTDTIHIEWYE